MTTAPGGTTGDPRWDANGNRIDDDNVEPDGPIALPLTEEEAAMPSAWRPRSKPRSFVWKTRSGYTLIDMNPVVAPVSFAIIWIFVLWAATGDEDAIAEDLSKIQSNIVKNWSWFYVGAINIFMLFCVYMAFSKYGDIRLGQKPDFNYVTWITMLFSAGIGIGLYFWGVQEPLYHYATLNRNNHIYVKTVEQAAADYAAKVAMFSHDGSSLGDVEKMYDYSPSLAWRAETRTLRALDGLNISYFNWGYSASATYVVIGLPLAYYHYNHNMPLSMRTAFYPILGNRINGWFGDLVDISAICGTVFGVCTSLGLGIMQLTDGLNFMDSWFPNEGKHMKDTYSWLICVITLCATISVVTGLEVGIRRMSELNFLISITLFVLIFFMSDPPYFLDLFITSFTYHFQHLFYLSGYADGIEKFVPQDPDDPAKGLGLGSLSGWTSWWTVFYWAWWISWSPFVGQFLARISKGRTIREFVLVNVGVTTLLVMVWFVVFGGQALRMNMEGESMGLNCLDIDEFCYVRDGDTRAIAAGKAVGARIPNCGMYYNNGERDQFMMSTCYFGNSSPSGGGAMILWRMLDSFPFSDFLVPLGIVGLAIFFITSSDSASQVVDNIASNGSAEPPVWQRILWAVTEGATALVLLHSGKTPSSALNNLRSVSIIFALPLTFVMLGMVFSMWVGLRIEDGNIKPKNYWKSTGVDTIAHLVGSLLCVGCANQGGVEAPPSLYNSLCCCFWNAANTPLNWVWALVTVCFPCVTQSRNFLEFSASNESATGRRIGLFGKINWLFWIIAPWTTVGVFSFFCEETGPGPIGKKCRYLDGVEGLFALFYCLTVMVGVMQRVWIRQLRGIESPSSIIMDAAWFCFCPTIAIYQAFREPRTVVNLGVDEEGGLAPVQKQQKDSMQAGPGDEQL